MNNRKNNIVNKLVKLKHGSGSHSPSVKEIETIAGRKLIEIDACFLSNPYASKLLFNSNLSENINENLFRILESYPPNQDYILEMIKKIEGINPNNSIVMSGAQNCIELILSNLDYKNCLLPIPTYSSYYESIKPNSYVHYFMLNSENNFEIIEDELIEEIARLSIGLLILINPNNPTGASVSLRLIHKLLNVFPKLKIIIDESFIHFSNDYDNWKSKRLELLNNKNTFFIKSMSKDFGIAGLRIGFMETQNDIIYDLKNRFGTLSINNLAV